MKITRKNNGITLIALIITVIVMLILAGVAISDLIGKDGLVERIMSVADKYNRSVENEMAALTNLRNQLGAVYMGNVGDGTNPSDPEESKTATLNVNLAQGMVPVVYNAADISWYVATEEQINNGTWYNYVDTSISGQENNSQWANVMLRDNLQVEGVTNANTANLSDLYGKKVTSEGSMYVWIPRYAYKITSNLHNGGTGIVGDIEVVFIDTQNKNGKELYSAIYPETTDSGKATGKMNDFVVHPAFSWAKEDGTPVELEGIWVGKFEASGADASGAVIEPGNVLANSNVIVRTVGNVTSWRDINRNNIFLNCYNMNNNNIYGISSEKDEIDPHLIKNTEWGAVAYLAHSKYGRNRITGNSMSNLSGFTTGNGDYKTNINLSTTGNVYGIYDMAGGSWEHTAAYLDSIKGNNYLTSEDYGKALYDANPKYKNVYRVSEQSDDRVSNYQANADKYGDCIFETSYTTTYDAVSNTNTSWNGNYSFFPYWEGPFLYFGGFYKEEDGAGVFAFSISPGNADGGQRFPFGACHTLKYLVPRSS